MASGGRDGSLRRRVLLLTEAIERAQSPQIDAATADRRRRHDAFAKVVLVEQFELTTGVHHPDGAGFAAHIHVVAALDRRRRHVAAQPVYPEWRAGVCVQATGDAVAI